MFKKSIFRIKNSIKRFYFPFIFSIISFFIIAYLRFEPYTFENNKTKIILEMLGSLMFGIVFCTFSEILNEKYNFKINKIIYNFILVIISFLPFVSLYFSHENRYVSLAIFGIAFSLIIMTLYFLINENFSEFFSYIFKNTLFNLFVCAIIFAGISICFFAFTSLIYNFDSSYKIYTIIVEFIVIVLFINLFLANIPKINEKIKLPGIFKTIILKVMFPIYFILLVILYVYLIKILFIFTFPSNLINIFVSLASLGFVFFVATLTQFKTNLSVIKIFLKFGGYVIIPLIAMQFFAIYIRVSNYGLTTARYASIVLNIFALFFAIYHIARQEKCLKNSLIVLASTIFTLTVLPCLNILDLPVLQQTYCLEKILKNNGMLENNKIIKKNEINSKDKERIISCFRYIVNDFKNSNFKPKFLNLDLIYLSTEEIFGFPDDKLNSKLRVRS
ncbi:MAG: DUF4153 domain-containing protein [Oscillospiraceae bacterium]|jgi:hypothetical protein|nr:DUF4153 domain-containing protein [Oscillospiraceae bacterium]